MPDESQEALESIGNLPNVSPPRTVYELMGMVLMDPKTGVQEKAALIDKLRKGLVSDRWTFRWAIWILGLVVLLTITAVWHLTFFSTADIPEGLIAIGSAAAGGLAGLLTPKGGSSSD